MISVADTSPGWVDIANGMSSIATVAAVIVGGIFAYYKFARGRIFRIRCGIETTTKMTSIGSRKCAIVKVQFGNEGQAPVSVYQNAHMQNKLIVLELNELMLEDALGSLDDVVWEGGMIRQATLFPTVSESEQTVVESGEKFSTSVLMPLSDDTIGFRAIAILQIIGRGSINKRTATYWAESIALPE